jgi:hypothetical protein
MLKMRRHLLTYAVAGALLGILLLHPISDAIDWLDLNQPGGNPPGFWKYAGERILGAFSITMLPNTAAFGLLGAALAVILARYGPAWASDGWSGNGDTNGAPWDLVSALRDGEGETLEWKATLRWDVKAQHTSRVLEDVVLRTIAGFANQQGGTLLIGIADSGEVTGLTWDYATLRRPDRDGLSQLLVGLVQRRLGGDICPLIHVHIHAAGDREYCRLVVQPSLRPVFLEEDGVAQFYVRAGNTTRALDAREVLAHAARRWRSSRLGWSWSTST